MSKPQEKLPVIRPITTDLIPDIECLTIFDVSCRESLVVMGWITEPADKELPAASTASRVNNFVDYVFFRSIRSEDRSWLGEFTGWEEVGIIGEMRFYFGGVEDGICVCWYI
jgi:hypothetical protein